LLCGDLMKAFSIVGTHLEESQGILRDCEEGFDDYMDDIGNQDNRDRPQ